MKKYILFVGAIIASIISFSAHAQAADSLKTAIITVSNLSCNNDMPTIKKQLQNQEGIDEISFTAIKNGKSEFTVLYHSSATNLAQIVRAIEATPGCDDAATKPYKVKKEPSRKNKKDDENNSH